MDILTNRDEERDSKLRFSHIKALPVLFIRRVRYKKVTTLQSESHLSQSVEDIISLKTPIALYSIIRLYNTKWIALGNILSIRPSSNNSNTRLRTLPALSN